MNKKEFIISNIKKFVRDLMPGTSVVDENKLVTGRRMSVSRISPTEIEIQYHDASNAALHLKRLPEFSEDDTLLIRKYYNYLKLYFKPEIKPFWSKLSSHCEIQAIASYLTSGLRKETRDKMIPTIIEIVGIFQKLAGRTYEREKISLSITISSIDKDGIKIGDFFSKDFALVLTNGIDTTFRCSAAGYVYSHEYLSDTHANANSPLIVQRVANLSTTDVISIVLNRNSDILIFSKEKLQFSNRRLRWQFYSHSTLMRRLGGLDKKFPVDLRRAIYETVLDVSFARTGGLIVITQTTKHKEALRKLDSKDLIKGGDSLKAKFISMTGYPNFKKIERKLRMELLAIDGAVILDRNGNIVNIGAIIMDVKPTEEGGARTAAAKAMAEFGVAIKISMDGEIKVYKSDKGNVINFQTFG